MTKKYYVHLVVTFNLELDLTGRIDAPARSKLPDDHGRPSPNAFYSMLPIAPETPTKDLTAALPVINLDTFNLE
jgi:hypothetical protein